MFDEPKTSGEATVLNGRALNTFVPVLTFGIKETVGPNGLVSLKMFEMWGYSP